MPANASRAPRRSVRAAWSEQSDDLVPFCRPTPYNPDWLGAATERKKLPVDRSLLQGVLARQYAELGHTPATAANLVALAQPSTFTVCTGQQPGLFGGPLYTLYKAVTALRLAQDLSERHPEYRFVPVFWVASEDHDAAEVNHCWTNYSAQLRYPDLPIGPVGRHLLTPAISELTKPYPWLAEIYRPGRSWSEAFRRWLHFLLGDAGLILLEPDDAELKAAFAPVIARELEEPGTEAAVHTATEALAAAGYPSQIFPRPVNLFLLHAGQRLRIDRLPSGQLTVVDGDAAAQEALRAAQQRKDWAAFSPNVVLRPLYQETVLPNLAYLGGWAEVGYWLQLQGVFRRYTVFQPYVLPRAQAVVLPQAVANRLEELAIPVSLFLSSPAALRKEIGRREWPGTELEQPLHQILGLLSGLEPLAAEIDAGQVRNLRGAQAQTNRFFAHLERHLRTAYLRRHPALLEEVVHLQARVQPSGYVQERTLTLLAWGAEAPEAFAQWVLAELDPHRFGIQPLVWPG